MIKTKNQFYRALGVMGSLASLGVFIANPSFPTPDKLIIFIVFVFMAFGEALEAIRRFGPFVVLILVYESFRGLATQLNNRVDYLLAPHLDKKLFGSLPTADLQRWLWHGHVRWYDYVLYLPYFLHFVIPLLLGIIVWKTRDKEFWHVMNTYLVVAFGSFVTFLAFPAAPPWLASQNHYIQPIVRISSQVWAHLGIQDFPSVYNHIAPNPVAAIPSLHAAWATLLFIFVYKIYGWRWSVLAAIYPLLIFVGTVYDGEHYIFDVLSGIAYAAAGYWLTLKLMKSAKHFNPKHNFRALTAYFKLKY